MKSEGWKLKTEMKARIAILDQSYIDSILKYTCNKEKDKQLQRGGNAIHDEVLHALKDTPRHNDALDDGGQTFLCQHDIRRCSGSIRS